MAIIAHVTGQRVVLTIAGFCKNYTPPGASNQHPGWFMKLVKPVPVTGKVAVQTVGWVYMHSVYDGFKILELSQADHDALETVFSEENQLIPILSMIPCPLERDIGANSALNNDFDPIWGPSVIPLPGRRSVTSSCCALFVMITCIIAYVRVDD